ncbi:MAG: hypothetical protein EXR75_04810, partial [Myxococcales bacterium]|nr:hypothetical protein [Myxococcales bacterium]
MQDDTSDPRSALELTQTTEFSGFHRLGMKDRRTRLAELTSLSERELDVLSAEFRLTDAQADKKVENALGVMGLPLG